MAIKLGDAFVSFKADMTDLNKSVGGAVRNMKKDFGALMDVGKQIGVGFTAVGGAIAAGLGFAVKAAAESEQAQAQLAAVLKSTGEAAGLTADELNKMSEALARQTTFDDEAITGAQSLLLTFTSIGKEVFPEAIKTIADMSQALGQDLKGSTIQLGKALNDPIAGISALSKVGVSFNEQQKETIKTMVESGNVMGAQKLILAELSKEFGGSAAAAANTLAGQITQLKNEFGNLLEEIGNSLTDGGGFAGLVTKIKETVIGMTEWVKAHPDLVGWIAKAALGVSAFMLAIGPLLIALPGLVIAFKGISTVIAGLAGASGFAGLGTAATGAGTALTGFGAAALPVLGPAGVIAASIVVIGNAAIAWWEYYKAVKGADEQNAAADANTKRLLDTLREKGVAIDEAALKEMSAAEQTAYATKLANDARKSALASMGDYFQANTQLTEAEIANIHKLSSEQVAGLKAHAQYLQQHGASVESITADIRQSLARLSLDHRESPSINDMAAASFSGYMSQLQQFFQGISSTLSAIKETFFNVWNEIASFVGGMIDSIVGAAQNAGSAIGSALGLGGGVPGVPGFAGGGTMQRSGLAMVGERGPELLSLPRGTEIFSNPETMDILSRSAGRGGNGGGDTITMGDVIINNPVVRSDSDIQAITRAVSLEQERMIHNALAKRGLRPQGV
jgi:hypothetical protein